MINEIHPSNKIYIKFINIKKGWGVFCKEKILKGLPKKSTRKQKDEAVENLISTIKNL